MEKWSCWLLSNLLSRLISRQTLCYFTPSGRFQLYDYINHKTLQTGGVTGFYNNVASYSALTVDSENDRLYCHGNRFSIIDLKTRKIVHSEPIKALGVSSICYIPSPIDQLQLSGTHTLHIKYNYDESHVFMRCGTIIDYHQIVSARLRYTEYDGRKILFLLGGREPEASTTFNVDIYYCTDLEIHKGKYRNNWRTHKMELPLTSQQAIEFIIGFGFCLFAFYSEQIWCLDLKRNKWYKLEQNTPKNTRSVVKVNDNYLHFYCNKKGWEISLYDLLPKDLIETHSKEQYKVVNGYVRNYHETLNGQVVPNELKFIMARYLFCFN